MTDMTARLALPLLQSGQAQKEVTHNEALVALDMLVQTVAENAGDDAPAATPLAGQTWIVGTAPTGAWAAHAGALAIWTEAGWRFAAPFEGMTVWVKAAGLPARRTASGWILGDVRATTVTAAGLQVIGARQPAIATPGGGTAPDAEARAAIAAILTALRTHGLIAP